MAVTNKYFQGPIAQQWMLSILTSGAETDDISTIRQFGGMYASPLAYIDARQELITDLGNRASLTWGEVSSSVSITNTPVINVDAGQTINYINLCSLLTNENYITPIVFEIEPEEFTNAGTITITGLTLSIPSDIS